MAELDFALELKAVDAEQRVIDGYASVFGNEDSAGDVIEHGAFAKSLTEQAPSDIPVFIGHQHGALPVGTPMVLREDAHGLFTRTKVFKTSSGDDLLAVARASLATGTGLGMSIGYNPRGFSWKAAASGEQRRHLNDVQLGEYSFVAMPANSKARVLAVKQAEEKAGRRYSAATAQMLLARLSAAHQALTEIEDDIKASTDDGKTLDEGLVEMSRHIDKVTETKTEPDNDLWVDLEGEQMALEVALVTARGGNGR